MLHYRIHGELNNDTTPLVVMHGLLGSLDNWNTFASKQKSQRTVIAVDMRNHGDSPHVDGMGYQLMVADALELLDFLELTKVDLMGHSMGGKVAMWLALHHPERIRKLIIVDIAPVTYPPRHQGILQAMSTMPIASFKSRREADKWLSPTIKHPIERAFLLKNLTWNENRTFIWQCNLPEIARHYLKLTAFPATTRSYEPETLFIRGGQSDYIGDDEWEVARQYFPNARLISIDEAGHLPHVQTPDIFIGHVTVELD